jgi:hypothetical protein
VIIKGEERISSARLTEATTDGTFSGPVGENPSDPTQKDSIAQTAPIIADPGETLIVGGQPLKLSKARDSVGAGSLSALSSLVEHSSTVVAGTLERPPAAGQWSVPSATILAGSSGRMCVVAKRQGKTAVTRVVVAGQGVGRTVVSGDMNAKDNVLVAPDAKKYSCS